MMKWLPPNRMAERRILIRINPEDAGEQALGKLLRAVVLVVRASFIADGKIEKTVWSKHQAAGIVKLLLVELLHHDDHGIGIGCDLTVGHGKTRQSPIRVIGK